MTPERRKALERGEGCLLLEEWHEGWHFCVDMDLDLIEPSDRDETGSCKWCGFDPKVMPYPGDRPAGSDSEIS